MTGENLNLNEMAEFDYYDNLDLTSTLDHLSQEEQFRITADRFIVKMLNWAEQKGFKFNKAVEKRAFINYAYTSFFLVYYPQHQDWQHLQSGWENRAEILTKYMEAVYLLDDKIYDLELDPKIKKNEITEATKVLIAAIKGQNYQVNQNLIVAKELKIVAEIIQELRTELKEDADEDAFLRWEKVFVDLVDSQQNEFNHSNNLEITQVNLLSLEFRGKLGEIFTSENIPSSAIEELTDYLHRIENSIGSGLVYRTLLCRPVINENISKDFTRDLEEICYLINIYFRLANDSAEIFRAENDREDGVDSVLILENQIYNLNESERKILIGSYIYEKLMKLKKIISAKRDYMLGKYHGKNESVIIKSIINTDIGELFYKGTHYRSANRFQVYEFIKQLS